MKVLSFPGGGGGSQTESLCPFGVSGEAEAEVISVK